MTLGGQERRLHPIGLSLEFLSELKTKVENRICPWWLENKQTNNKPIIESVVDTEGKVEIAIQLWPVVHF